MKTKKAPKINRLKSPLALLIMLFVAFTGTAQITIDDTIINQKQLIDDDTIH
jgi:hypothetical protein